MPAAGSTERAGAPRRRRRPASCQRSERRVDVGPSPPKIIATPSTSRMFETTEPVIEPRTTSRQAVRDGEQRDDQLGRVAEARVQEAADARAGVLGRVLRRLADQPRERDQRSGREDEERRRRRDRRRSARRGRRRREHEAAPQDPARHAATLAPDDRGGPLRLEQHARQLRVGRRPRRGRPPGGARPRRPSVHCTVARARCSAGTTATAATPTSCASSASPTGRVHRRGARGVAPGPLGARLRRRRCSTRCGRGASRRRSSRTRGPTPAVCCAADAELFGLAERLDAMVFSEEVGLRKPDPAIFLHACGELEVEAVPRCTSATTSSPMCRERRTWA